MKKILFAAVLAFSAPLSAEAAGRDANPRVIERPPEDQFHKAWPADARQQGVEGKAVLQCDVTPAGATENCAVIAETPGGKGFGAAALKLAPTYRLKPGLKKGKPVRSSIRIPIWFSPPLDSPPDWLRKPTSDELQAAWPSGAASRGTDGYAVLQCVASRLGTLEACEPVWEDPPGMGFGAAALMLTPSFLMKPAVRDGQPVSSPVSIPISFNTDVAFGGFTIRMLARPLWAAAPSFDDMAAAWPKGASAPSGHVAMRCGFTREGVLKNCEVLTEAPRGQGFGRAARGLASKFQIKVDEATAPQLAKMRVNVPVHFLDPKAAGGRTISEPVWVTVVDADKVQALYPSTAADAGVKSGRGVADCLVAADGRLTDCKPAPAEPEGLGFSEAAVAVASVMRMNPWSEGGGPVDGARIRLPVRFNLAEDGAAPKP